MTRRSLAVLLALALGLGIVIARDSHQGSLSDLGDEAVASWIAVFPATQEPALRQHGAAVWARDVGIVLGGAEEQSLAELAADGLVPLLKVPDQGQWIYLLSHSGGFVPPRPEGVEVYSLSRTADLYLFPATIPALLPAVKPDGGFRGVPRLALPPIERHPADAARASSLAGTAPAGATAGAPAAPEEASAANPLVSQIVNATSQPLWFQDVKDLSGENPVTIDGQTWTISTRYSDAMFPAPADNAHATEYLLDRAQGWGYTGVRESYTSAESGCGQTKAWQNVIFTLPGQVDFGQHQQVLFVNHYDSLSFSTTESLNYAPGADDAISGGCALLEALRTFKDYGFRNTVKIIFFSGEEEGICGSTAYTRQHPSRDMWRVVNMDQTAFDGDHNRLMDVYNWDATNSPDSVALGDSFVQANNVYGPIIDPSKIVRDTSKMCQTDHCPFWDVGVAAIAVTEDLHNNDICPCFDQSQTPGCHDTVTQIYNNELMFTQDYSWPSEKSAVATVAALADPLYACPPAAPAVNVAPGNNMLHLTWSPAPGVTNTVIERAASCGGPFTALASVPGGSYDDTTVTNGTTYAYRLRTCPTQTGPCSTGTPQPGPSVIYQQGSAAVTADSGDHDNVSDNCELVTVQLNLLNDGNAPLTNVRMSGLSPSHPAVQVATAIPQIAGPLAVGATVPVKFKFYLGRNGFSAACGDALPFTITASSDQSPASVRSFSFTAEHTSAAGPLSYGFETDLSGWTVTSGVFTRAAGGSPDSPAFSLHSRNINNDCDAIISPTVLPTAASTMTMWLNFGIEPGSFDRALVRAIDTSTGVKTLLVPTVVPYNTTGDANLLCDNVGNLRGWSGSATSWRQASFNLSSFAGVPIQIEVRYSTDQFTLGSRGFWFDSVQITNASEIDCDAQSNTCAALPPEVSPVGSAVPFTIRKSSPTNYTLGFSESSGATKYNIYPGTLSSLHAGVYDHASAPGLCGFTDGTPGDGQVSVTVAQSTIPANSYLLAVAQSGVGESTYGLDSAGGTIPIALSSCP